MKVTAGMGETRLMAFPLQSEQESFCVDVVFQNKSAAHSPLNQPPCSQYNNQDRGLSGHQGPDCCTLYFWVLVILVMLNFKLIY